MIFIQFISDHNSNDLSFVIFPNKTYGKYSKLTQVTNIESINYGFKYVQELPKHEYITTTVSDTLQWLQYRNSGYTFNP